MHPLVMALALVGCGGKLSSDLEMKDTNNFKMGEASDMTLAHTEVLAQQDFCVDWSAMTTDIRGRPLVPSEIEQVLLVIFDKDEQTLVSEIVDDNYVPAAGSEPYVFDNVDGGTEACLSEMSALGVPFPLEELVASEGRTWLLSLIKLPDGRKDVQQTMVIVPSASAPASDAVFEDGLSSIALDVSLDAPPIETGADLGPYTLDWSRLKKDTNGKPWDNLVGDQLFIVNYDGTPADIEADFLLFDYNATAVYDLSVRGKTSARLDEAADAQGNPFPGFTTDGTWVVGITCSTCISPVPLAMAVVNVVE